MSWRLQADVNSFLNGAGNTDGTEHPSANLSAAQERGLLLVLFTQNNSIINKYMSMLTSFILANFFSIPFSIFFC